MTPRLRRWLTWGTAAVLVLFLGRWTVASLALWWWADGISPAALATVTRWSLLGLALDIASVLIASAWFAGQALLVARAIGSVQVQRQIGNLTVREAIPTRVLLIGALGIGVLLGLLTGVGARDWRAPVALAWQGVHYGIADPLLGTDLGVLVARYPVWHLAQRYAALLVILGLVLTTLLYAGIGALRRVEHRLELHPDARRHLGGLLALLALVIAAGYLLAPSHLATSAAPPIGNTAATARILATNAAAGAAIAVAAMCVAWALRGRHSLVLAGWTVFGVAVLGERLVIPALLAEGRPVAPPDAVAREMVSVAWGLHLTEAADASPPDSSTDPSALWDEAALARWAAGDGGTALGVFATEVEGVPAWLVATAVAEDGAPPRLLVRSVAAGHLSASGTPDTPTGGARTVETPLILPGRDGWAFRREGGVPAGGWLRRLALAWALQHPAIVRSPADGRIDWELDPAVRLSRLVPPLDWSLTGLEVEGGRLQWVLAGLATVERAPWVPRSTWRGRRVAGVVPAMVALVDAGDGSLRLFVDPAADALGAAWGQVFASIVEPATALPPGILDRLGYPREWLEAQLAELERPIWGDGQRPGHLSAEGPPRPAAPVWVGGAPARQAMFEDPTRGAPTVLLTAQRRAGVPSITRRTVGAADRLGAMALQRLWEEGPALVRLRDSVRAQGDTLLAGPVRWRIEQDRLLAWQVWWSAGRRGAPALLWIGTADGTRPGGGRRPEQLWLTSDDASGPTGGADYAASARLEALRGWSRRADSALARGDLTAFARAWEAMRSLLEAPPPE